MHCFTGVCVDQSSQTVTLNTFMTYTLQKCDSALVVNTFAVNCFQ